MVQLSLKGKIILVTGALGALAEAVNRRLLEAGATLLLTDILEDRAARELIGQWQYPEQGWDYHYLNVIDAEQVKQTIAKLFDQYPEINLMIGLAGGCSMHPFQSTSEEIYNQIFILNYFGQLYPSRAVLKEWINRSTAGHIIYTSSLVAGLPWVNLSAYISAKAAVEKLSSCLALEYAPMGIRFNCIAPGHVAAGSSHLVYEADPAYRKMTDQVIPLQRLVRPKSIADAFLYLCSDMAEDVDGQVIKVDCGASIPKIG